MEEDKKAIAMMRTFEKILDADEADVEPLCLDAVCEWLRRSLDSTLSAEPEWRFKLLENARKIMNAGGKEFEKRVRQKLGIN